MKIWLSTRRTNPKNSVWIMSTLGFVVVLMLMWFASGWLSVDQILLGDTPSTIRVLGDGPAATSATGPLRVDTANPRYFMDGNGKAIFLTGSHTWDNRQDIGNNNFDYDQYLLTLQQYHHNFIRLYVWEQPKGLTTWPDPTDPNATITPEIFARVGPGQANDGELRFDLTKYNQAYFDRLRQRIIEAGKRGIYVSVMLFNGWSVEQKAGGANPWVYHPFNSNNNINGINGDPNNDQSGAETHTLQLSAVTALQEAYVRKAIDTVNDLDNVLYEISNESETDSTAWQYHMINYIKSYEATKPKQHPVGMTSEWPSGNNNDLFASPADWIAPNGDGGYSEDPPVADGSKVVVLDTDHIWGIGGDRFWAWKSFTRGYSVIYMDPWKGEVIPIDANSDLRVNMGYILSYAERMNLEAMTPQPDLCSTRFCLVNPAAGDAEYLIYLPSGRTSTSILEALGLRSEDHKRISSTYLYSDSKVTVDLSGIPGFLNIEWFNPANGIIINGGMVAGGSSRSFTAPFSGDAVLYIYDARSSSPTPSMTSTPTSPSLTPKETGTFPSAAQTQIDLPASMTPTPPGTPLPCAQGFLFLGGLFCLAIVWSASFIGKK